MFDIGFSRIVWKEFRTQFQVWGALVGGALLLQVLFHLLGRDFQRDTPNYPLEVALVLTACYALTSAAILYAGEREERTDELLKQLPLPAGRLLWGKLTYMALSVLAFALIAFGLGYLVKVTASHGVAHIPDTWGQHAIGLLQGAAGLVLWGLFFSLLLSRVMAVLFAAVTTQLFVAFVAGNFLPGPFEAWLLGIGVIVAAADIWLARHWLSGRSVVPVFEGNRATTDRRSRFWLRSITWAAGRTPLVARESAVLLWRELRTAVPFTVAWSLLGILMVDLLMRGRNAPWNVLWICATPLVFGLWTCLGDNRRQTFRFLTDRGLSPALVWLTKHAVWFSLAVGLVLLFGLWDIAMSDRMRDTYSNRSTQNLTAWARLGELRFTQPGHYALQLFRGEMALRHVSLAFSLGLSLYLIGHLCSLWFRRVAIAVGVALVTGILLFGWHSLVGTVDIPYAYATWPLAIVLLLASLVTAGGWMHERAGWRYRLQQTAWVVVPVVGVVLASLWYRANQIPLVALDFNWKSTLDGMQRSDPAWTSRWRTVFGNLEVQFGNLEAGYDNRTRPFAEHQLRWLREDLGIAKEVEAANDAPAENPTAAEDAADQPNQQNVVDIEAMGMGGMFVEAGMAGGFDLMEGGVPYDPWDHLLEDDATVATLDQLTSLAADLDPTVMPPRIDPAIWEPRTQHWMQRVTLIGKVLAAAAQQHAAAGDLDAAWEKLHAGLVLTDYLQRQVVNPVDLHGTWTARETVLQQIHAWAAHPDQTPERLQTAREAVAEGRILAPAEQFTQRQYAWERSLIESGKIGDSGQIGAALWESLPRVLRPSERERTVRLMSVITAGYQHQHQHGIRAGTDDPLLNWPWVSPDITEQHIERWRATTPLLPESVGSHTYLDQRPLLATQSATLIVLELQAWRLEHGEFPATLHELAGGSEDRQLPRDPYTFTDFGYAPQGFTAPVLIAGGTGHMQDFFVPTNTPLLWSRGGPGGEIIRSRTGEYYKATWGVGNDAPGLPDAQATAAEDTTRVLFVILGRWPWQ